MGEGSAKRGALLAKASKDFGSILERRDGYCARIFDEHSVQLSSRAKIVMDKGGSPIMILQDEHYWLCKGIPNGF